MNSIVGQRVQEFTKTFQTNSPNSLKHLNNSSNATDTKGTFANQLKGEDKLRKKAMSLNPSREQLLVHDLMNMLNVDTRNNKTSTAKGSLKISCDETGTPSTNSNMKSPHTPQSLFRKGNFYSGTTLRPLSIDNHPAHSLDSLKSPTDGNSKPEAINNLLGITGSQAIKILPTDTKEENASNQSENLGSSSTNGNCCNGASKESLKDTSKASSNDLRKDSLKDAGYILNSSILRKGSVGTSSTISKGSYEDSPDISTDSTRKQSFAKDIQLPSIIDNLEYFQNVDNPLERFDFTTTYCHESLPYASESKINISKNQLVIFLKNIFAKLFF